MKMKTAEELVINHVNQKHRWRHQCQILVCINLYVFTCQ